MAEPLLHLGDIRIMREGIGRRSCPHRMDAQTIHLDGEACLSAVLLHHVAVDRVGVYGLVELTGAGVPHRSKERAS